MKVVEYTKSDLVKALQALGYTKISERLVTDWISMGLLGEGRRLGRGKGGGRGAKFVWSDEQFALFRTIVEQRPRVKSVVVLTAIPVETWLYWGERWVELPQVKRALTTWWGRTQRNGWDSSLHVARVAVNSICPPNTPRIARQDFREILAEMILQKSYSLKDLTQLIESVRKFGPEDGLIGQFGIPADLLARSMISMVVAMEHFDEVTDEMYEDARKRIGLYLLQYASWQILSTQLESIPEPPND